jgi:hypothetical protein
MHLGEGCKWENMHNARDLGFSSHHPSIQPTIKTLVILLASCTFSKLNIIWNLLREFTTPLLPLYMKQVSTFWYHQPSSVFISLHRKTNNLTQFFQVYGTVSPHPA